MARIVATTKDGFLLEISASEIANLLGYYSEYNLPHKERRGCEKLAIGDTIKVAAMFHYLHTLEAAGAEVTRTAAKLRAAADLIETLPAPIAAAKAAPDTPESNPQ